MTPRVPASLDRIAPLLPRALVGELEQLPPALELVDIPFIRAGSAEVKRRRRLFSHDVKPAFLRYLGQNHAPALGAMGLNEDAIAMMRDHGDYPQNMRGQRMNASIDHIVSLNFGGSNDFSNLVLLPRRLNDIKKKLGNLQLQHGREDDMNMTDAPRPVDGATPHVPYIEGGFKRERMHR